MRKFRDYILESEVDGKNGHFEIYYDEDTGENIKFWVDDLDTDVDKSIDAVKGVTAEELKKIAELRKRYNELKKAEDEVTYELDDEKQELSELKYQYKDVMADMEETIAAEEDDIEKDRLAQKFGKQLNDLTDKIEAQSKRVSELLDKRFDKYSDAMDAWKELSDYAEEVGYTGPIY